MMNHSIIDGLNQLIKTITEERHLSPEDILVHIKELGSGINK